MSDIFISYASEDLPKARDIAEALAEQGWTVWWDRRIPPGKTFDEVISEALDTARCVIVLWSKASTLSNWVKEEAAEGARRNILVPVLLEDVTIPLGFRRIQAARLMEWRKNSESSEFNQLLESVAEALGAGVEIPPSLDKEIQEVSGRIPSTGLHAISQQKQRDTLTRWIATAATFLAVFVTGWGVAALIVFFTNIDPGENPAGLIVAILIWLIGLWLTYRVWNQAGRKGGA